MGQIKVDNLPDEYKEIYEEFIMPVDTNIGLHSVILSEENKEKVQLFLRETAYRDKLLQHGLCPMNRILMYGASGCGKTFLSKALSNHLGYTMLYIDIAKALSADTVSLNISQVFKLANYLGQCVLMLDECDSIAWQRDTDNGDSGTIRRATNTMFQHLDQMNSSNIFIAATNMLHRLDNAFERRFNMKMGFHRPEINIKGVIKKFIFPSFMVIDDVDGTTESIVERRAKQYTKLSYYELQGLVERAMKTAVLNDTNTIRTSDIYRDLANDMRINLKF